jgi:hypothetical protein
MNNYNGAQPIGNLPCSQRNQGKEILPFAYSQSILPIFLNFSFSINYDIQT